MFSKGKKLLTDMERLQNVFVYISIITFWIGRIRMKKYTPWVLILTFVLTLAGCRSGFDGTTATPELDEIVDLTQEQLDEKLLGLSQEEIHSLWGEPDGMMYGFRGDIYHVPDSYESIMLYYDVDGIVETVKVNYRNDIEQ